MARILVVDDDANARDLLRMLCEHAGHEVVEASSADQACAFAFDRLPDLVITDLSMPGRGGPELIRALRRDPRTRTVRIALYTATTRTAAMNDFMAIYDVCAALPKPSEPAELLGAIDAALRVLP